MKIFSIELEKIEKNEKFQNIIKSDSKNFYFLIREYIQNLEKPTFLMTTPVHTQKHQTFRIFTDDTAENKKNYGLMYQNIDFKKSEDISKPTPLKYETLSTSLFNPRKVRF